MELEDLGIIKRMVLPDWMEEPNSDENENTTFRHPKEQDVEISFYYRGKPLSSPSAANLNDVLKQPLHTLSDSECDSIEVVMRDASEPEYFRRKTARTDLLNGVKVLILEGLWIQSARDGICFFIPSQDEGVRIDEIYYLAPPEKFERFKPEFLQSLASIQWQRT